MARRSSRPHATSFVGPAVSSATSPAKDGLAMSAAKGAGVLGLGIIATPFVIAAALLIAYFVFGTVLAILQWGIPFVGNILFGFLTR